MSIYKELDVDEIINAVSFFPELKANSTIQGRLNPDIEKSIEKKSTNLWNKDKRKILQLLIKQYFDLEAYQSLNEIDLLSWAAQFIIRKSIIDRLTMPGQSTQLLQASIFELMNEPVVDIKRRPFMFLGHFSSVNELTISELQDIATKYIDDGTFEFLEKNIDLVTDADEDVIIEDEEKQRINPNDVFNLLVSPVEDVLACGSNPKITATIDLSVNDAQLEKDFADLVSRKRQELNIQPLTPRPFKRGKIRSLIENRVLEYLDLKILDLYVNNRETMEQHTIADYIFAETDISYIDVNTTEKVRKSTLRYANEMMNKDFIASILAESKTHYTGDL